VPDAHQQFSAESERRHRGYGALPPPTPTSVVMTERTCQGPFIIAAPVYVGQSCSEPDLAVFTSFKIPKILQDFSSHRIFGRMHEVLNIGKKNN
jgi:hypothetical protein